MLNLLLILFFVALCGGLIYLAFRHKKAAKTINYGGIQSTIKDLQNGVLNTSEFDKEADKVFSDNKMSYQEKMKAYLLLSKQTGNFGLLKPKNIPLGKERDAHIEYNKLTEKMLKTVFQACSLLDSAKQIFPDDSEKFEAVFYDCCNSYKAVAVKTTTLSNPKYWTINREFLNRFSYDTGRDFGKQ